MSYTITVNYFTIDHGIKFPNPGEKQTREFTILLWKNNRTHDAVFLIFPEFSGSKFVNMFFTGPGQTALQTVKSSSPLLHLQACFYVCFLSKWFRNPSFTNTGTSDFLQNILDDLFEGFWKTRLTKRSVRYRLYQKSAGIRSIKSKWN